MAIKEFNLHFDTDWSWVDLTVNQNKGSDLTILTIGDSWTWGDELGKSWGLRSAPSNDTEYRISKVFGKLLSDKLESNWVQIALPGGSWDWITGEVKKILPQLVPQTENLIVIINYPDPFREIVSIPIDHPLKSECLKRFQNQQSLLEITEYFEQYFYQILDSIYSQYPNIKIIANPAFVNPIVTHKFQTDKMWFELLFNYQLPDCYIMGSGMVELDTLLNEHKLINYYKKELLDVFWPSQDSHTKAFKSNPLFFERCHPNEQGHEIWANYLYDHIKNSL